MTNQEIEYLQSFSDSIYAFADLPMPEGCIMGAQQKHEFLRSLEHHLRKCVPDEQQPQMTLITELSMAAIQFQVEITNYFIQCPFDETRSDLQENALYELAKRQNTFCAMLDQYRTQVMLFN
jgi:hypothetical protein